MFFAGLSPWIALLAGLVPGVAVAVVVARLYQRKLHDLAGRMDTLHRAREQTNELLLTARRQADMLSKELEHVRRQVVQRGGGAVPHPVLPVAPPVGAGAAGEPGRTDGFGDTEVGVKDHQGFADTLAAPRR
jgi:hypothetical protein